ncbi:MAG: hypothetical protein JWO38_3297 [Gemmataceae bacterium]|nr:hypothetical protein [Gemmataceae bacterium]
MTPDRVALLDRVLSFDIDGPSSVALPFAARLARENGWSRPYADRVIREYKRYVFLAATAAEPVCPSEDVDAAWHLHLTYTRSYWKRFCGEILGVPLHHDPTRGGPAEAGKHLDMYRRTLAVYREAFGHEPPADIWSPAETRFGEDLKHRVVSTAHNWVIPKLPVKRVLQTTAAFVAFAAFVPGCEGGGLNPFNLVGADFVYFLIPMMIAAVCVGRVIRSNMRNPDPQPGDDTLDLTWEQAAFLAGGYPRLTTAAIARLVECEAAAISEDKDRLTPGVGMPVGGLSPVETAVYNLLPFRNTRQELKPVQEAVEARFSSAADRLEAESFILSKGRQVGAGFAAIVPLFLVVLFLAVPRLLMGVANGKPVGYLVATIVIGGCIGLAISAAGNLRLSRRGENLLVWLRSKHAGLRAGAGREADRSAGLAVALFGTAALAGLGLVALQTWFPRQTTDGSSGGCGSGCGASSDGGGGGGDGSGDGGGGCGGCGGGGD